MKKPRNLPRNVVIEGNVHVVDWGNFERSLSEKFGVNAMVLDIRGNRKTGETLPVANSICAFIRNSPKGGEKICDIVKTRMLHAAGAKKRLITDECAAGMVRLMIPILTVEAIEGFVSVCGRPFVNSERIYIDYIQSVTGMAKDRIQSLLSTLKPVSPRAIRQIKEFISGYFVPGLL